MLEIIKKLVAEGKIANDVAEVIGKEVESLVSNLRDEAAKYRLKAKEALETLQKIESEKLNVEKKIDELTKQIEKAKEEGKSELVKELEKERKEKEELAKHIEAVKSEAKRLKVRESIRQNLKKYNPISEDIVLKVLESEADVDGDKVVVAGKDINEYVEEFFKEHPELIAAKGAAADVAGVVGGGGQGGQNQKTLTEIHLEQAKNLS